MAKDKGGKGDKGGKKAPAKGGKKGGAPQGKEAKEKRTKGKSKHPKYEETTITCGCGNVLRVRSTKKDLTTEICSACHPFFREAEAGRYRRKSRAV